MQLSLQEVQLLAHKTPQVCGQEAVVHDTSFLMRRGNLCLRGVCGFAYGNIKRG